MGTLCLAGTILDADGEFFTLVKPLCCALLCAYRQREDNFWPVQEVGPLLRASFKRKSVTLSRPLTPPYTTGKAA